MNKKEVLEIRKLFGKDNCRIERICGCYVDGHKEKKLEMKEAFLSLPDEEMFKYIDIFKKTLSGTIGKNLLNLEFPLDEEMPGGCQQALLALRNSELRDPEMLDAFYDKIISTYLYPENYLILLIHGSYDIPSRSSDNQEMFDASDYVYQFLLCSICAIDILGIPYTAPVTPLTFKALKDVVIRADWRQLWKDKFRVQNVKGSNLRDDGKEP